MAVIEARMDMRPLLWPGLKSRSRGRRRAGQEPAHDMKSSYAQFALGGQDGLVMLYGHPMVIHLTLQAAADRALSGDPVVYLDAAHTFDALIIGRCAKARRQLPKKVLGMVHVARAFSWHQMERLVSHCLSDALERYDARIAVISGLFESLAEEEKSDRDIARMSDRLAGSVEQLKQKGYSLLCPCPSVPMETAVGYQLFARLRSMADRRILAKVIHGDVQLEEEQRLSNVIMEDTAGS
jgi:hypothetical protein